jgi:KUP system potassium uptake protein
MVTTTLLAYFVAREVWLWKRPTALAVMGMFLAFDLSFFAANLPKIPQGGWFPLVVAALVFLLMSTWKQGRRLVAERLRTGALPLHEFIRNLQPEDPPRVPGTAIFLTAEPHGTPTTLLHNLKHNKVLHQKVVLLTVMTEEVPTVPPEERLTIEKLDKGFYRLTARYGFIQDPRAADVLKHARAQGLELDVMKTTFFLGRETLIPDVKQKGMALWRRRLFAVMAKNSERFNEFFRIPPNRVVELGMQVKL